MNYLALDIGKRRTGVAFAEDEVGVPLSLETLIHESEDALLSAVQKLYTDRHIDHIVIGLPLLLSGEEGSQASFCKDIAHTLSERGISCSLLDERYSTPRNTEIDPDSAAACAILSTFLDRK